MDKRVEVTSPDTLARDRGKKFCEYEEAGVPEYWLIDPDRERAEFYVLGPRKRYRLAMEGAEGKYQSQVIGGFWLKIEWLWKDPMPSPLRALTEIAGLSPEPAEAFEKALQDG